MPKENLISLADRPLEERRRIASMGGKRTKVVLDERRTLKAELLLLLKTNKYQEKISTAVIKKAMMGDVKAFEVIRDTIGEKAVEKQESKAEITINNYKELTVEELKKLAGD